MYYFIGLFAILALLALSIYYRNNVLTIISAFIIVVYFVDYPLLLSPFPPYLPDATAFSTESLAVSIFGYSSIAKWLYNGGAYPVAFIWNAITSMILATQPIYLSSYYGIFEPTALGLTSYIVGRRMISDNKNVALAPLAVLIFTALITYQSYYVIYSLGYHYNIGRIYNTNWLIGYELLSIGAKTGTIYYQFFTSSLFDYNKDDLLYITNDISIENYTLILNRLMQTSIIYNDGINLISSRYMMH
jgi:hypothetical protein